METKNTDTKNKKLLSGIIQKNPIAFVAICIATISLAVAVFSLVLGGINSRSVLKFYPDGNGDYIVAVGDAKHLSEIEIPKRYKMGKVVGIDDEGFAGCDKLTSIVIPDSVTCIGNNAFEYCTALENVSFGKGLEVIGSAAFYNCTALKTINLPDGLIDIGESAFTRCESLTSISIPDSVTYIGALAFHESESLTYKEYNGAYYLGNEKNPYHTLVNVKNTDEASYEIHPSTKVIYSKAFSHCTMLEFLDIPEGVKCIGAEAFYGATSLSSIILPKSLSIISDRAFYDCDSLSGVYYTGAESEIYKIWISSGNEPFSNAIVYCEYTRE